MKVPILYALTYLKRIFLQEQRLQWEEEFNLSFEPVNIEKFPCFHLALEAIKAGGNAPIVLNAANEAAVKQFLDGEISYIRIAQKIEQCLSTIDEPFEKSVEALNQIDSQTRKLAITL